MPAVQKTSVRFPLAASVAVALLTAPAAIAAPITFALTGHITTVLDTAHLLDGTLREGGALNAHYTVDHDDAGGTTVVFGDGQTGRRVPSGGSVNGGSYGTSSGGVGGVTFLEPCIFTLDCSTVATYHLVLPLLTVDGLEQEFRMDLQSATGSLFGPVPFWERLDGLQTRAFSWSFRTSNGTARVEGVVTSLQSVPEPSTLLLLVLGLLPACRRPRRRCRPPSATPVGT